MSQLLKRSPQRFPVQHHCYLRIRQVVQIIQPVLLCYSLLLRFPVCTGGLSPGNFLAILLRHRITLTLHSDSRRSTGTIRPYRCSCSVFCSFLVQSGINSFSQLSVEITNLFTSQDSHTTFRGRTTRFVHLRGFLLFLEEQSYTTKHGLYNCFLAGTAPVEKIVDVLTPEQISRIESYRGAHNNPIELRDIAIVLLGLKMGFRASDITHLCFSNIDWKKHEISIVMQKTKVEIKLPMPVDVGNAIYSSSLSVHNT